MHRGICYIWLLLAIANCKPAPVTEEEETPFKQLQFEDVREVLIVGTYHFDQESDYDELDDANQQELDRLITRLEAFNATKVFIEKDPKHDSVYNVAYQKYLTSEDYIKDRVNEIFQLGFRMAKRLGHDSIYLFDNKPPFIGSLDGFSFDVFGKFKDAADEEFNKKHYEQISDVFQTNGKIRNKMSLYDNIKSLNSVEDQQYNISRMHAIEVRSGVNDTWIGADWLGRWYQRNIRMMMHVMQRSSPDDRIIIFVGSNHKWVLEQLMTNTPEFNIVDAMPYLERTKE